MAVGDRVSQVQTLLERLKRYSQLVTFNSFTDETLSELKANAKSICDDIKSEVDLIKTDIEGWT